MFFCSIAGYNFGQNSESDRYPPQIEKTFDEPLLKKLKVNFEFDILLKENSAGEAELSSSERSEP